MNAPADQTSLTPSPVALGLLEGASYGLCGRDRFPAPIEMVGLFMTQTERSVKDRVSGMALKGAMEDFGLRD